MGLLNLLLKDPLGFLIIAMRQLMKDDGIQERYGNDYESKRIFKQQIEQSHGLYHR